MHAMELALPVAARQIIAFEGFRSRPYLDSAGVWTIGVGSITLLDGSRVTRASAPIDLPYAVMLMSKELRSKAVEAEHWLPAATTFTQLVAFYNFMYNEGVVALQSSTLMRCHRAGEYEAASKHFADWVYAHNSITKQLEFSKGLSKRREIERKWYMGETATVIEL